MKIKPCLYFLGLSCFPISIMALINIFYSFYFDYLDNINSYSCVLALSLFVGFVFYKSGKKEKENISIYEQIFLIFLVYFFFRKNKFSGFRFFNFALDLHFVLQFNSKK